MTASTDRALSDADALVWTIERDPALRSTITSLVLLDRPPDVDRLRERLERVTRVVPRLRQRVTATTPDGGSPVWVTEPDVDLDYHLRHIRLPAPADLRAALDVAERAAMTAFDPARPLWEATVADGLERERAAMVVKLHHAITDGLGAFQIAGQLVDLRRDGGDEAPMPEAPPPTEAPLLSLALEAFTERMRVAGSRVRGAIGAVGRQLGEVATDPAKVLELLETVPSVARLVAPAGSRRSPLFAGASSLSWRLDVFEVPKDDLRRAAKAVGCTLNDAFLGIVSGGLDRYHAAFGAPCDALRMTMPVNIRDDKDPVAGNRFTPVRFDLPLGPADPAERLRALHRLAAERRKDPALALTDTLAAVLNGLPAPVATQVFGSMLKGVDIVASNVPGSPVPLYVGGAEVQAIHAFAPPSGAALSVTLISHVDRCCLGVQTDPAAVTDLPLLMDCLREAAAEVLALAGPAKGTARATTPAATAPRASGR